jgi:hypothetical protein
MINFPMGIILTVAVLAALFLILREAMCWYWKINRMIGLMETFARKFDSLDRTVRLLAENQSILLRRFPETASVPDTADRGESYEQWTTEKLLDLLKNPDGDRGAKIRIQEVLSARYGIGFEEGKYRYRDYVSDDFAGAVECARLYNKR